MKKNLFTIQVLIAIFVLIAIYNGCKKEDKNTPPNADFIVSPVAGPTETIFSFDASGCTDAEDLTSTLQVRWDWESDGIFETDYSTNKILDHKYTQEGNFQITLEVKDSKDLGNSIKKSILVSNDYPSQPFNPFPPDSAIYQDQDMQIQLSWECIHFVKFDIYFGTSENPPLWRSNIQIKEVTTEVLQMNTTYYWKVVAKDNESHTTEGPIWQFITGLFLSPPDANFSFTASGDGRTIQFTNESTDALTYLWDFGDTQTSTDVNPTHAYPDYGTFTVTLTATGEGGTDEFSYNLTVFKASPVKLDDNSFDDWANIAFAFQSVDNSGGLIEKVKVDFNDEFIYFYMEVKDNLTDSLPTGMHFDLDNDITTGFLPWTHTGIGSDFYIEAGITTGTLYESGAFMFDKDAGSQYEWVWITRDITDYIFFGYHVQVGDKVQTEWAIRKNKLSAITINGTVVMGDKVTIIFNHYLNWEPAGFFPGNGEPAYILEMTSSF